MEEKPNIVPHDEMVFNFKTERRNGDATHVNPKSNHTAHDQITLIKQFLMGENDQPPPNSCHVNSTVRIDGGVVRDSPPPWSDYPGDASSFLSELSYQQDDRFSAPFPPCSPQNGMQPSFYTNGYDHVSPGKLPGQPNSLQRDGPQQMDSVNLIYPLIPDITKPSHPSMSNPFVNGAQRQDICDVHVQAGISDLNKVLQNGTESLPSYLRQEGTVIHSLKQRFDRSRNGFYHPNSGSQFPTVTQPPSQSYPACGFMGHASATEAPNQDPSMWFGPSNTVPLNHIPQVPQVEEVLSVDDLTPSLLVDPMVPYGDLENLHNGHPSESMYPDSVHPINRMHFNKSMGQNYQTPQNVKQKRVDDSENQRFQPGGNNSILKMMLTL